MTVTTQLWMCCFSSTSHDYFMSPNTFSFHFEIIKLLQIKGKKYPPLGLELYCFSVSKTLHKYNYNIVPLWGKCVWLVCELVYQENYLWAVSVVLISPEQQREMKRNHTLGKQLNLLLWRYQTGEGRHPKPANTFYPGGCQGGTRGLPGKQRQANVSDKTDDIWRHKLTRCHLGT